MKVSIDVRVDIMLSKSQTINSKIRYESGIIIKKIASPLKT